MASMVIPNRRRASKDTNPQANAKPSRAARPRQSGVRSAAPAAEPQAPTAAT